MSRLYREGEFMDKYTKEDLEKLSGYRFNDRQV
jgi:hypothetical protein